MTSLKLFKNVISYSFGIILSRGISLILLPVYTFYLTPDDYGNIEVITTILQLVILLTSLQIETSYQRYFFSKGNDKRKEVCFLTIAVLSLIALFIFIVIFNFTSLSYEDDVILSLLLIPFIAFLTNINVIIQVSLRSDDKIGAFNLLTIIQVFVTATYTILSLKYFNVSILHVFIGQIIGLFCVVACSQKFVSFKLTYNIEIFKALLSYSLPQVPARILSFFNTYGGRFSIVYFLSPRELGIYAIAMKISSIVMLLHQAFSLSWAPYIFKIKNLEIKLVNQIFRVLLLLIFLIVAFFHYFSDEIQSLLSSGEYKESSQLISALVLSNALFIIKEIVDIGPKIKKQTKYISYSYAISSVSLFLLLILLTPYYSLFGVVYASVISNVILISVSWYYTRKLIRMNFDLISFIIFNILTLGLLFYG
ncbi:oligosaccharide flippase family protein [Vibrio sp.]|nr:oligosaccharide flippase family protein [Vibrio sp.]